jgi:hypothetical protein
MGISILAWLSSRDPHITELRCNIGRGMITRPMWKCPCIKLSTTYFRQVPITIKVVSTNPTYDEVYPIQNCCQWLAAGRWFSLCTLVSSTNKTNHHDIAEILLKVALNTITLTQIEQIHESFGLFSSNLTVLFPFYCVYGVSLIKKMEKYFFNYFFFYPMHIYTPVLNQ